MNACRKLGIVICLMALCIVPAVWAQEVIDPQVYKETKKNLLLEKLLEGRDPQTLSRGELHTILVQTASATSIPQVGAIIGQDGIYVISTGQSGEARGVIPWGEYEVFVTPLEKVEMTIPKTILVSSRTGITLAVAMREQSGKGIIVMLNKPTSFIQNVKQKLLTLLPFFQKQNTSSTQPVLDPPQGGDVQLKLFKDLNGNALLDGGEKLVPWAGVKIGLRHISHEERIVLKIGDNKLTIPQSVKNIKTTSDLILQFKGSQKPVSEVHLVDVTQLPHSLTYKNGETFGNHFPLFSGNTYLVKAAQETPVVFIESDY